MSKVLVTGGAGFIGSHITRELIEEGHEVVILDSFSQYVFPFNSNYQVYLKSRFEGIDRSSLTIVRGDTRNSATTRRVIMEHRPSKIIHMASLPIATLSNYQSEEAIACILLGTINILEVIRDVNFIDRFVYASSSMVYGDFQYHPADEEHPKAPMGVYGGAKYAGEIMIQVYGQRFGVNYTIVRPSAVYGPTDSNRRVSQIFIENALKGKPLRLDGGGTQKLDFTYVTDTAHGFVLAAFHDAAQNEVFNITYGEGRSLKEFAEILSRIVSGVTTVEGPADEARPERGALDIAKARRLLGYEPQYSLEQGLEKYVEFVREFVEDKER